MKISMAVIVNLVLGVEMIDIFHHVLPLSILIIAIITGVVLVMVTMDIRAEKVRDFRNYLRNCWKYRLQLKHHYPWDSECIEFFASAMYTDLANHIEKANRHVGCENTVRRARVIAHLLKRENREWMELKDPILEREMDDWWNSRTEVELSDGCTRIDFPEDEKKDRLRKARQSHLRKVQKHRDELLLSYLRKYQYKLWD